MGERRGEEPLLRAGTTELRLPPALEARGERLLHFPSIGSTMDEARHCHDADPHARVWIVADAQEAGRGRSGRQWRSPPGNLHLTYLTPTVIPPRDQPKLGFAAGVALAEAAAASLPIGVKIGLKWPNDLLVDGAKASGILLEGFGGGAVAFGLGVNIAAHPDDTPYAATHLAAFEPAIDRNYFFSALSERLSAEIERFEADGFESLRRRWLSHAAHLGRMISVRRGDGALTGRFEDIDADGRLILVSHGSTVRIDAGDVFPLDKGPDAAQERHMNARRPDDPAEARPPASIV